MRLVGGLPSIACRETREVLRWRNRGLSPSPDSRDGRQRHRRKVHLASLALAPVPPAPFGGGPIHHLPRLGVTETAICTGSDIRSTIGPELGVTHDDVDG